MNERERETGRERERGRKRKEENNHIYIYIYTMHVGPSAPIASFCPLPLVGLECSAFEVFTILTF